MFLENIRVKYFRNHPDSFLEFGEKANVILGNNGEGKTNLLEAISYISLTKSFYASSDSVVIALGEEIFDIDSNIISDRGTANKVHIGYSRKTGEKVYKLNNRRIEPFASIIGKFPIVILSPENAKITFGGPADRRKFLDMVISQSNIYYFENLSEYRKIIRHRNKIFFDSKIIKADPEQLLEPWNKQLIKFGSKIMKKRREFVKEFQKYISTSYNDLVGFEEVPDIDYSPSFTINDEDELTNIEEKYSSELIEKYKDEIRLGTSLVGPHRDEINFKINNLDLRKFASQGQHKSFLVALKIGEFFYLKERCNETPIFLLDDVFSELDESRVQHILKLIESLSQTFITSTNFEIFDKVLEFNKTNRKFFVKGGKVEIN